MNPIFFNSAPIAIKLAPNAIAGLPTPLIAANPLKKYLDNRPEIKTLTDYEKVVPELNQDVTDILLKGLKIAGLN